MPFLVRISIKYLPLYLFNTVIDHLIPFVHLLVSLHRSLSCTLHLRVCSSTNSLNSFLPYTNSTLYKRLARLLSTSTWGSKVWWSMALDLKCSYLVNILGIVGADCYLLKTAICVFYICNFWFFFSKSSSNHQYWTQSFCSYSLRPTYPSFFSLTLYFNPKECWPLHSASTPEP